MFGDAVSETLDRAQTSGAYGLAKRAAWTATSTAATLVLLVGALFGYFCYTIGVAEEEEHEKGTPHGGGGGDGGGGGSINVGYALALLSAAVTVMSLTHIFFEYRKIVQLLDLVEVRTFHTHFFFTHYSILSACVL